MNPFIIISVLLVCVIFIILFLKKNQKDDFYNSIESLKKEHQKELDTVNKNHLNTICELQTNHKKEISQLKQRLNNFDDINMHLVDSEFYSILKYYDLLNSKLLNEDIKHNHGVNEYSYGYILTCKYKLDFIMYLYPELSEMFYENLLLKTCEIKDIDGHTRNLFETVDILNKDFRSASTIIELKNRVDLLEASQSNLTAIPYMAKIMADYETYGLEFLAKKLDWGYSREREKKVKSIREIRKDAQAMVEKNKEAQFQLAYLLELFPVLEDVIETDFKQLPAITVSDLSEHDSTKDWLTKEEYASMSTTERNQLALDRYKNSKNKSKWQIGRDYELYIGYKYSTMGFTVDHFGSYMGLEDLGRDLIATRAGKTVIVQCKYWSTKKQIHEKHIMQLYGTTIGYCIEKDLPFNAVSMVLITNIQLSPTAKKYAEYLNVQYKEYVAMGNYPCIKCNIGHNEYGNQEKIYHLPFDQKYDVTKIDKPGEFFAMTVKEAEDAGFRRAFKWFNS